MQYYNCFYECNNYKAIQKPNKVDLTTIQKPYIFFINDSFLDFYKKIYYVKY